MNGSNGWGTGILLAGALLLSCHDKTDSGSARESGDTSEESGVDLDSYECSEPYTREVGEGDLVLYGQQESQALGYMGATGIMDVTGDGLGDVSVDEFGEIGANPPDEVPSHEHGELIVDSAWYSSGMSWEDHAIDATGVSMFADFNGDGINDLGGAAERDGLNVRYGPVATGWEWDFRADYLEGWYPYEDSEAAGDGTAGVWWNGETDAGTGVQLMAGPVESGMSVRDQILATFDLGTHHWAYDALDMNVDGVPDVFVLGDSAVYFFGPISGAYTLSEADVSFTGHYLGSTEDLNLDGYPEIVFHGATDDYSTGSLDFVSSSSLTNGDVTAIDLAYASLLFPFNSAFIAGDANDLTGDGRHELLVGMPNLCDGGQGRVYLVSDPGEGVQDLDDAAAAIYRQGPVVDQFGWWISGFIDFDGDGRSDLIVSDPFDSTYAPNAGAIFFFPGGEL